jgi:hypothetical protein
MNNVAFIFSRIFLQGILIVKGLTARRLYKSLGVKGLKVETLASQRPFSNSRVLDADAPVFNLHLANILSNVILLLFNSIFCCERSKNLLQCHSLLFQIRLATRFCFNYVKPLASVPLTTSHSLLF